MRGVFISFEGGEGCGKSTQIRRVAARLEKMGRKVLETREPGGTDLGEAIRHLLKHSSAGQEMCSVSEMFLFCAARAQLVRSVIVPALEIGCVVLCDRFLDSTTVYQGMVRGLTPELVAASQQLAVGEFLPKLTILLDLPVEVARVRLMKRVRPVEVARLQPRSAVKGQLHLFGVDPDRIGSESDTFHQKVRDGYLELAKSEPERIKVIDASGTPVAVGRSIWEHVQLVI